MWSVSLIFGRLCSPIMCRRWRGYITFILTMLLWFLTKGVRTHFVVQIPHQHHNVNFIKPLLCVQFLHRKYPFSQSWKLLFVRSTAQMWCSSTWAGILESISCQNPACRVHPAVTVNSNSQTTDSYNSVQKHTRASPVFHYLTSLRPWMSMYIAEILAKVEESKHSVGPQHCTVRSVNIFRKLIMIPYLKKSLSDSVVMFWKLN